MSSDDSQQPVAEIDSAGRPRIEPSLSATGLLSAPAPPVVPQVALPSAGFPARLRRFDARVWAFLARLPVRPEVLAWSMLGLGLSIFVVGLAIYFWGPKESEVHQPPEQGQSPKAPQVDDAGPVKPEPSISAAPAPVDFGPALAADSEGPVWGKIHLEKPVVVQPRPGAVPRPDHARPAKAAPSISAASAPAAAASAAAVASSPQAKPINAANESLESVFGVDDSGNGVPDVLDRWGGKIFQSKVILAAAQAYYRTALPLATKAQMGVTLTPSEKLSVLRATECYLITSTQEGLRSPPNLNDRVLIQGGQAAERLKGLFSQLQATDYAVSGSRKKACE